MYDLLSGELPPWFGSAIVLVVGTAIIVAGAVSICRLLGSAAWQRAVWQIGVLGLAALVAVELTGMGTVLARLGHTKVSTQAPAVGPANPEQTEPAPAGLAEEAGLGVLAFADRVASAEHSSNESTAALAGSDDLDSIRNSNRRDSLASAGPAASDSGDGESPARADETHRLQDAMAHCSPPAIASSEPPTTASISVAKQTPTRWPVAIWTGVGLILLARVIWIRLRLVWFGRRCDPMADTRLRGRVDRLARLLGLRRPVRVLQTIGLATPVACGLVRPTIILPTGFAGRFDGSRQEVILAHELAHLAGRDPAWQLLADVLCAVLWWNPLTYFVRSGLRAASEAAADEASLLVPGGPDVLAGCLVSLGRQLAQTRRLGWLSMGGSGFKSCLGKRIERLLGISARSWRPPRRRLSALAKVAGPLLLVFVTVFCTVWARSQASLTEGESTMNILTTSWRRSLAATAVMACLTPLSGSGPEASADDQFRERTEEAEHHERERIERADRAQRERAERRAHGGDVREMMTPERDELLEEAEEIEREIHELGDDQDEEARELRSKLKEIRAKIGFLDRKLGQRRRDRPGRHDLVREMLELQGRELELEVELRLLPEGHQERADDLRRELEEIKEHVERIKRENPNPPQELVRVVMDRRVNHLKHALRRVHEAGKPELAERMEREIHELAEEIEREFRHRPGPPHPEREGEMDRRHAHVKAAMENLHAAGLHDLAEELAREIEERMHGERHPEWALRLHHPERPPKPRYPDFAEPGHDDFSVDVPPRSGDMEPIVEELRGQMDEMRQEMDELREMLKEALERE